jgi:hypothetical protein
VKVSFSFAQLFLLFDFPLPKKVGLIVVASILNHVIFFFLLRPNDSPILFSLLETKQKRNTKFFWIVFVVFISRQLDFVVVLILDERRELEIRKTGLNRHRIDELNREFIISLLDGPSGNVILLFLCSDVVGDGGKKKSESGYSGERDLTTRVGNGKPREYEIIVLLGFFSFF